MQEYLDMIDHVLTHGLRKENRTGVDTLSVFNYNYKVDISDSYPLLTTKDMSGSVWNSLVHELIWYLSGEHHIREFSKHSKIWDAWADDDLNLETAYGRFWRRYPVPNLHDRAPGEAWAIGNKESMQKFVREEKSLVEDRHILTFDQIAYIVDLLLNNPNSRRMVLTAWHPANAGVSKLPPCFAAGTLVATTDGYLPIEEVKVGQEVLSATGTPQKVTRQWVTPYDGEMLSINFNYFTDPTNVTPNHPFLVEGKGWIEAGEVEIGDRVGVPVDQRSIQPSFSYTYEKKGGDRHLEHDLTPDDFYTLGYFLGDGWCSHNPDKWRVCFSVNKEDEPEILPKLRQTIKISAKPGGRDSVTTYQIRSKKWINLFREFGYMAQGKKIPDWVHAAPVDYVENFLKGYFDADGTAAPSQPCNSEIYMTVSTHVAYGLQRLLAKVGKVASVYRQDRPDTTVIEGRTVNQRDTYMIKVSDTPAYADIDERYLWVRVRDIQREKVFPGGQVFNIEVENEHTYTANNLANHNCHYTATFNVSGDGRLNCHLTQRSGDLGLGIPFNIACYSALTYIMAKATGFEPGEFAHTIVDLHIYCGDGEDDPYSHVPALKEQLTREPKPQPTLEIKGEPESGKEVEWIDSLKFGDFRLKDYEAHPRLRMKVAV